jgi:predicted unusual protein kinase regulating ubiquinone biosynthesis (AarF/ABC1/UbiB family)
MGGVLIKVGQFLSARVDVLPPEFTAELEGLQDEVPAEDFQAVRKVAEAELGAPLSQRYETFDETPLAAASLGQVHRARLLPSAISAPNGVRDEACQTQPATAEVVVKIQRPDIEEIIATDLSALRTVGKWLDRYRPIRKRADVPALLAEFTRILYEEIDYLAEGRNAETFAANFADWPGVRVPQVIWTHTTRRVLTLENVWAIKITDYDAIARAGVKRAEVASRLLDTYLKQIFEDGFFHADPHPGNLFVQPLPKIGACARQFAAGAAGAVDRRRHARHLALNPRLSDDGCASARCRP